ncbi:DUF4870 domain-containing protein [Candidatus Leptofilum sp.]|uniref:DUF4870 domain-containing protein n=1 Tax=Candidatus Leptofilum sp. TaxID=3241576 RepID=UPI003B5A3903
MSDDIDVVNDDMSVSGPTDDDKLWSLLAYVFTPVIPIVILLMDDKKSRPFIKAHNAQALAWGLVNLIGGTILSSVLFFCVGLPSVLIWAVGAYWGWQAYQGQEVTIPVITDFVKGQGWA